MCESLESLLKKVDTSWLLCGDFNEVRNEDERFNSVYIPSRAMIFNNFISNNELIEAPLGGRKFTRVCDNGIKMSKLDRFLVCEKFINLWEDLSAIVMDRKFSDYCPILLRDKIVDFGPKPFKFFNEWLNVDGVDKVIKEAWNIEVKDQEIKETKKRVDKWELLAENEILLEHERMECRKQWLSKERSKVNMLRQKSRIKWILEGDENSSYFHGIIRRKYNSNNIQGLVINGNWNENACDIMNAIHSHFELQFKKKCNNRPTMSDLRYPVLSEEQAVSL
ncbi:uncharacterized protein [Rutidosis leptorrhynchoides]|uniref:uncharacterized protein n=1 Tax=Rutidosis leptorrhynchoides TaxID=125765 RepID=UPI003A9A40C3